MLSFILSGLPSQSGMDRFFGGLDDMMYVRCGDFWRSFYMYIGSVLGL